jgi:hypothetical protein
MGLTTIPYGRSVLTPCNINSTFRSQIETELWELVPEYSHCYSVLNIDDIQIKIH